MYSGKQKKSLTLPFMLGWGRKQTSLTPAFYAGVGGANKHHLPLPLGWGWGSSIIIGL